MSWYLKRSVRLGPFLRLNLSKRGLGVSAGVKGARIGVDAGGEPYVHAGRRGLYYRARGHAVRWGPWLVAVVLGALLTWLWL